MPNDDSSLRPFARSSSGLSVLRAAGKSLLEARSDARDGSNCCCDGGHRAEFDRAETRRGFRDSKGLPYLPTASYTPPQVRTQSDVEQRDERQMNGEPVREGRRSTIETRVAGPARTYVTVSKPLSSYHTSAGRIPVQVVEVDHQTALGSPTECQELRMAIAEMQRDLYGDASLKDVFKKVAKWFVPGLEVPALVDGIPSALALKEGLIFGKDDRIMSCWRSYPWWAIGRVSFRPPPGEKGEGKGGTAFLIGPQTIMTAAHVVGEKWDSVVDSHTAWPGEFFPNACRDPITHKDGFGSIKLNNPAFSDVPIGPYEGIRPTLTASANLTDGAIFSVPKFPLLHVQRVAAVDFAIFNLDSPVGHWMPDAEGIGPDHVSPDIAAVGWLPLLADAHIKDRELLHAGYPTQSPFDTVRMSLEMDDGNVENVVHFDDGFAAIRTTFDTGHGASGGPLFGYGLAPSLPDPHFFTAQKGPQGLGFPRVVGISSRYSPSFNWFGAISRPVIELAALMIEKTGFAPDRMTDLDGNPRI